LARLPSFLEVQKENLLLPPASADRIQFLLCSVRDEDSNYQKTPMFLAMRSPPSKPAIVNISHIHSSHMKSLFSEKALSFLGAHSTKSGSTRIISF
jgi:hypothetical protein